MTGSQDPRTYVWLKAFVSWVLFVLILRGFEGVWAVPSFHKVRRKWRQSPGAECCLELDVSWEWRLCGVTVLGISKCNASFICVKKGTRLPKLLCHPVNCRLCLTSFRFLTCLHQRCCFGATTGQKTLGTTGLLPLALPLAAVPICACSIKQRGTSMK